MPRWFVQLEGDRIDLTEFPRWFPSGNVYAIQEGEAVLLTGSAFEKHADADAVRAEAKTRLQEYSAVISLLWPGLQPPMIGNVFRENERGGRDVFILLEPAVLRMRATVGATLVSQAGSGSPQELQLTQAQEMLSRITVREQLRTALRLLSQKPLTPTRLYKILEIIERDLGCTVERAGLCSNNERERFRRSVNSDEVMGDDARHAAGKSVPPENPMHLNEAITFIRRLLVALLSR